MNHSSRPPATQASAVTLADDELDAVSGGLSLASLRLATGAPSPASPLGTPLSPGLPGQPYQDPGFGQLGLVPQMQPDYSQPSGAFDGGAPSYGGPSGGTYGNVDAYSMQSPNQGYYGPQTGSPNPGGFHVYANLGALFGSPSGSGPSIGFSFSF